LIGGAVALALAHTHDGLGADARTKWPNDVWIGGRKIAGILIEAIWSGEQLYGLAVGIGWNVNQNADQLPPNTRTPATSLRNETGREWDRGLLLRDLLTQLARTLDDAANDPQTLLNDWESREVTLGREVEILGESRILRGTVRGIHSDGSLALDDEYGAEFKVGWGEASLLPLMG
jgi:BirA family biotin operon repressor/biotin-[acetyl-CoA-carboxylase] ligase